jgi:methionyl-tRNA synthetase
MALDIPLPRRILTHAHWTLGKQKMAKSTGNVVNPFFALDRFGMDVMRFYLAHDGGIVNDADYDNKHIIKGYKHYLYGQLGNLASRVTRGKGWNLGQVVKSVEAEGWVTQGPGYKADSIQWQAITMLEHEVSLEMEKYRVGAALHTIMNLVSKVRGQIDPVVQSSNSHDRQTATSSTRNLGI